MSDSRAVPFHCPFCGEEDLRPYEEQHGEGAGDAWTEERSDEGRGHLEGALAHADGGRRQIHGAWECRTCTRVFSLKLIGLRSREVAR